MMNAISFELYYLAPMLIIGIAIIILLLMLLLLRVTTKTCALFAVGSLFLALIGTVILGYQLHSGALKQSAGLENHLIISAPAIVNNTESNKTPAPTPAEVGSILQSSAEVATTPEVTAETASTAEPASTQPTTPEVSTSADAAPMATSDEPQHSAAVPEPIHPNEVIPAPEIPQNLQPTADSVELLSDDDLNTDIVVKNATGRVWQATYVTALFTYDGYGLLYTGLILMISIIVASFAYSWFKCNFANQGVFYLIMLFSTLGGVILAYSSHLISLFIGVELLSTPLIGLIGFQYSQKNSIEAVIKYMVLSAVAMAFLLMGIAFYYAATGELTFSGLSFQLSTQPELSSLLLTGVCLMLIGIGFKLSLVPFQLWLPDVFQGAPTAVSLFLSTVGKMAIFCAIARLFLLAPIVNNQTIQLILIIMAFCSILVGNFFALMQENIKRLIAYTSIANFGYLFVALIAVQYQVLALETIGVYLIGYILSNICVFGVISMESSSLQNRDKEMVMDLRGLFWRKPIMALAMGIGLLSLAGMPLTIGFIGRFSLLLLGITAQLWWLIAAIVIGSVLGLYIYTRLIINLYLRSDKADISLSDSEQQTTATPNIRAMKRNDIIVIISALLILFCGIYPQPLFILVSSARYLIP
ncbi:NADH-quinone oxidoreductase subunit NuoN [Utexia brackfieldae]|uniref:NADH-quinone oxidoreductase subunit NuoN n=1 Tax=Utexia brackfieldae TaxID=3074108 RepID=UPI00370D05BC